MERTREGIVDRRLRPDAQNETKQARHKECARHSPLDLVGLGLEAKVLVATAVVAHDFTSSAYSCGIGGSETPEKFHLHDGPCLWRHVWTFRRNARTGGATTMWVPLQTCDTRESSERPVHPPPR